MADIEKPGVVDLFKQLIGSDSPTTSTDAAAIGQGFDPSNPDILKAIAAQITKMQATGEAPDEETTKTLGAAVKSHMNYNANLQLLQNLQKAYTTKYGAGKGVQ